MDLFDLNPAEHSTLAQRAAAAALELSEVRRKLATVNPGSDMFARLDDRIERLREAAETGTGLAAVSIPSKDKIQSLSLALSGAGRAVSTGLAREKRSLQQAIKKGNLQKPFQTVWSIPGVIRSAHHDKDTECLDQAIRHQPALNHKLVRIANEERERLILLGVVDSRMTHPELTAIKRLSDVINGYARDLAAMESSDDGPHDHLLSLRVFKFEKALKTATTVFDFN
jgi:hypothetical protein